MIWFKLTLHNWWGKSLIYMVRNFCNNLTNHEARMEFWWVTCILDNGELLSGIVYQRLWHICVPSSNGLMWAVFTHSFSEIIEKLSWIWPICDQSRWTEIVSDNLKSSYSIEAMNFGWEHHWWIVTTDWRKSALRIFYQTMERHFSKHVSAP